MAREFKLPELGEGVEAGSILKILVSLGEVVQANQAVLELETDKATVEVPIPFGGKVVEIRAKEGARVEVGQAVLVVEESAAPAAAPGEAKVAQAPAATAAAPARPAPAAPAPPPRLRAVEKDTPAEGRAAAMTAAPARRLAGTPPAVLPAEVPRAQVVPAAPSVRRIAREIGVDISEVRGSGAGGRISLEDVKSHAQSLLAGRVHGEAPQAGRAAPAGGVLSLLDFERWGAVERKPMSGVRRKTAEHLAQAWTAPHVTHHDLADITELDKLRQRYAKQAEEQGVKLTLTAIALKVVASALKVFPHFNSSLDLARSEIVLKSYCHIGVAVDTEHGLLVPVIRDVDQKNILALAGELGSLAEKARERKLALEEMQGGCFTITNLGGIGGTSFTPIVNFPEVAILGLSRSRIEPIYREGGFVPRLMLPLSLSYDHRAVDGADAARFVRWLVEALEQPFLLSLEG